MTTMAHVPDEDRLQLDLAAARRARTMITDPLSIRTLGVYIDELEKTLRLDDDAVLLSAD